MKLTFRTVGSISVPFIPIFLYYRQTTPALICLFLAIVCFITWAILDRNVEKKKPTIRKSMGVGHNEDVGSIIKAIADESDGFLMLQDIVRITKLPCKRIQKTIDWLYIHDCAIERKGRIILTPEGRTIFSNLINPTPNKTQT
jgi:hypothetical protein